MDRQARGEAQPRCERQVVATVYAGSPAGRIAWFETGDGETCSPPSRAHRRSDRRPNESVIAEAANTEVVEDRRSVR